MMKRTSTEWQTLFAEQETSGLSATAFCRERKLCAKYFNRRKKQLSTQVQPKTTAFIPAKVVASHQSMTLRYANCEIRLNPAVSPAWLADLLKQLV